tara:strand:- start:653 stop:880 length:228 start_codon:yes stop_codon:yes gene_type:complete
MTRILGNKGFQFSLNFDNFFAMIRSVAATASLLHFTAVAGGRSGIPDKLWMDGFLIPLVHKVQLFPLSLLESISV